MSFFQWLREGVRQAVVLGLADAVEDVGTRTSTEDFGPALAQSLRERLTVHKDSIQDATVVEQQAPAPARRRLGRSLESLKASTAKAA
jgi:hypothetical protein